MPNKTVLVYRMKTPEHVKKAIDMILHQLEDCGRAFTTNGAASRVLSRFVNDVNKPDQNGKKKMYFVWDKDTSQSVITLSTSVKLVRTKDNRIKLIGRKDFGNVPSKLKYDKEF